MATTRASLAPAAPASQIASPRAHAVAVAAEPQLPNGFSVDLEDHETLLWQLMTGEWIPPGKALDRQIDWLLGTLAEAGATATFFTVADLARHRGDLIRRIAAAGHEIGCHGLFHASLDGRGEAPFRAELRETRAILEDAAGQSIHGYRAPFFSLREDMDWAHRVLLEEGYRYDASGLGAAPGLPRRLPSGLWEAGLGEMHWGARAWPYGSAWLAALPAGATSPPAAGGTVFYMHPYNVGWNRIDRSLPRSLRVLWLQCRHQKLHNLLAPRFRTRLTALLRRGRWTPLAHLVARAEAR